MKFGKKRKFKSKKGEDSDTLVHYCPLKLCRVEQVVCGKVQSKRRTKCFKLNCEYLDSDVIIDVWEKYKDSRVDSSES